MRKSNRKSFICFFYVNHTQTCPPVQCFSIPAGRWPMSDPSYRAWPVILVGKETCPGVPFCFISPGTAIYGPRFSHIFVNGFLTKLSKTLRIIVSSSQYWPSNNQTRRIATVLILSVPAIQSETLLHLRMQVCRISEYFDTQRCEQFLLETIILSLIS